MKKHFIIYFISLLIITSCGVNKFKTSTVKPSAITELTYFEPVAYIKLIKKGNQPHYDYELSKFAEKKMDSILYKNKKINLTKKIEIADSLTERKYEHELSFIIKNILQSRKIDNIHLTPTIDSIMMNNNSRFSMATVVMGFSRKRGNYGKEILKRAGIGILTLGLFTVVSIKSQVSLYTLIFDSKNKNIAFYRHTPNKEKSPIDSKVLAKEINWTFKNYFYKQ